MGGVGFQYDPFGRRVAKTVLGATTNYLYEEGANPVQELSGTTPTANLLTGDIASISCARTRRNGNKLAQYTYEPFGNTTVAGSATNPYQYTGRENDGTGLYS
jgi:hypothetical protein